MEPNEIQDIKINKRALYSFPVPIIVTAIYLMLGFLCNLWHPGWLIFFAIPVYYQFVTMFSTNDKRKRLNRFPIAIACTGSYLLSGFVLGLWHPTWIIFLFIPIYYSLVNVFFR